MFSIIDNMGYFWETGSTGRKYRQIGNT
uniref:Uncharacterized protein n=1 Tax=Rhizophora mucronata TaxID=61149 RepID=A0A2P2P995_RHIMU